MTSSPEYVVVSGRLRVVFERRDDRWGHRVEWCSENGGIFPLLESLEGSSAEDVLISPPMQELRMQANAQGASVALGVGTSRRNHWSMAVTPGRGREEGPVEGSIMFSLACRLRENVPELVSTYHLNSVVHLAELDHGGLKLSADGTSIHVFSDAGLRTTGDGLAVVAAVRDDQELPHTSTWSYWIAGK